MQATKEYTVTKAAGPRVAGKPAKPGQHILLTEVQARAELLAGAIVPKAADAKDGAEAPTGTFDTSDKIDDIRARARGRDAAPAKAADPASTEKAEAPAGGTASPDPIVTGMSSAGAAAVVQPAEGPGPKPDAAQADATADAGGRRSGKGAPITPAGA